MSPPEINLMIQKPKTICISYRNAALGKKNAVQKEFFPFHAISSINIERASNKRSNSTLTKNLIINLRF